MKKRIVITSQRGYTGRRSLNKISLPAEPWYKKTVDEDRAAWDKGESEEES